MPWLPPTIAAGKIFAVTMFCVAPLVATVTAVLVLARRLDRGLMVIFWLPTFKVFSWPESTAAFKSFMGSMHTPGGLSVLMAAWPPIPC